MEEESKGHLSQLMHNILAIVEDQISFARVEDGEDGRGIKGTPVSTYAQSTSGTTPPTTWSDTRPNVPAGQYLWTRVVTTYTDDTTSETQTPTLMGKEGTPGLGIKSKSISYAIGTSGNTPPTSGWQESIPSVSANQYLWTKTTLVYTDDSKTEAYSVGKMGANGADAKLLYLTASAENIVFNADDTPKTTQTINITAKLQNVTGTATFAAIPYIGNTAQAAITLGGSGNTRTLTSAQWTNKNWTLIVITATLDNLSDTLSIVKVKDGKEGEDGQDAHIYQAYAWSADGTDRFTTTYPGENLVLNYDFSKDPTINGWTGNGATIEYSNGNMRVLFNDSSTNRRVYYSNDLLTNYLPAGVKYSVTIDAFSNNGGYIRVGNFDTLSAWQTIKQGDTPSTYKFEGLTAGTNNAFSIQGNSNALIVRILKIKIELGNTATIYTSAPSENFINAYPSYVGSYTTFDDVQSTNPADYTWQRFMGNQGKDGEDGISIVGVEVQYAQTTTSTEPTSGWSYTRPTPIPGQYLWTRTRNKFSDGTFGSWATFPTMIGRDAIVVSEIAPANPSIGTLWQKPSDPNVQKWNGTKWENWGIAPENIVADNLVVKDGRFEKLVGAELESGTITNSFDFWDGSLVPNTSAQMWRRGKTTIKNAEVTTLWEDYNKSTGAKVKEGGVIHDSDGTSVYINDPSNFNQTASYRSSGILLRDSRVPSNVSGSFLSYNDLLIYPATPIPAASGWSAYATSGANQPMAVRYGRSVRLTGAFKNNTTLPNTNEIYKIGTLPVGLRPSTQEKWLAKGAGTTIFQITVDTNGDILVNYRLGWTGSTFGYLTNNSGDIFNIAGGFAAADI
nr:MAG TPA: tail protein [Caudoviricetes sp.]